MLSSWVPHWVVGDYVGEDDDDHYEDNVDSYWDDDDNFEDDDDNYEDEDDSYEDDIDSYGDDDDVAAYSYLGLVVGSPSKILPASLLRSWKGAGMRQRDRRPPPNTEWGQTRKYAMSRRNHSSDAITELGPDGQWTIILF